MSVEKENISNGNKQSPAPPKKSFFAKLFKWFLILIGILFLLLIGIFFFIQSNLFDKWALGIAMDRINESLKSKDSRIYAESLEGNLFKGFVFKKGSVTVKGDTLLKFDTIYANYNIWRLLDREISVQNVVIKTPQIYLTKVRDEDDSLMWNLSYLLEQPKKDIDTTITKFDWGITSDNIIIENGTLRILENKNSDLPIGDIVMEKLDTFKLGKLDVYKFNLNLSARYFPDVKEFDIRSLSFKTNSDFNVNNFKLHALINEEDTLTKVNNLAIVTDRSDIMMNEVSMVNLNPFKDVDYAKFGDKQTTVDIDIKKFNFDDLTFFLPDINFLDSVVALRLKANGNYGNLNIQELNLHTPNSNYSFEGRVDNLEETSLLYFDIRGKNIEIDPRDTKLILPGLSIPDYSYLGKVYIPTLTYLGEPLKFNSGFVVRSSVGNVDGKIDMDLTQQETKYKGDISTANLNIGRIIKDKSFESSITGEFIVDARGFDYRTMSGKLNYSLQRTKFYGQNIAKSDGHLNFNRGSVSLDFSYFSDALKAKTNGRINISNIDNISYDLRGSASNLNIAAFTKDNSQRSDLSFDFDVNGRGFDPNTMSGTYKVNMNQSSFGEFNIPANQFEAAIEPNGNIRSFTLNSTFLDLTAEGSFKIENLISVINTNVEKITTEITKNISYDSSAQQDENITYSTSGKNFDIKYSVNIKDPSHLQNFLKDSTLIVIADLKGMIEENNGVFTLTTDGVIKDFRFQDSTVTLKDANINLNIKNNITGYQLTRFEADVDFFSNKVILSNIPLDSTRANIHFLNNTNKFTISSSQDSTIKLFTDGNISLDSTIFNFDSLSFRYKDFLVSNDDNLIVKYDVLDTNQSLQFRKFVVKNENQKFTVQGDYSLNSNSDVIVLGDNIKIATYQKLLNEDIDTNNLIGGNIRRVELLFKGTLENPDYHLEANSDVLRIGRTRLGRLDAFVDFKDNELKPDIAFYNINNTGSFKFSGNLPFLNPIGAEDIDSVERSQLLSGRQVDINAVAKNFQLRVFQQLLPYTSGLGGILDGTISLKGTPEKPQLTGNMDISRGKFFVSLTRMNYNFNAAISTANEKLVIQNSKVFVPEDPTRFISTTGYIDFSGLKLNDIHLAMTGDVKAFDKDNGQTELGISGDLWVGSGTPSLQLNGNSSRIDLKGNLVLVRGNVTFNPFVKDAYNIYSDDFIYGVIIDSVKSISEPEGKIILQRTDSVIVLKNLNLNPFEKILFVESNKGVRKLAVEEAGQFFYNLYITTSENFFLKFIVNERTQQEFFGEIRTELYIDNFENDQMSGRGTVTLGDNSYYKFFRKFDATGKVIFNGPISNPELDITAQYKGLVSTGTSSTGEQNIEDVIIDMRVTGSATNPLLTITLDRNGVRQSGSNATSDAMSFLLFGKFKDQLTFNESSSFGANLGASLLTNYVSSSIEELFPFLINTNLSYIDSHSGTVAENTDIRFTAAIGDAIIRVGGQIFKGIANTDIVIDYPLNKIFKAQSLSNNFILRLEKVTDPFINSNDISNTNDTRTGALIYYKIKF